MSDANASASLTAVPSIAVITSPALKPASAAAPPAVDGSQLHAAVAPVLDLYAQLRVRDRLTRDERRRGRPHRVGRDREADAVVAARVALDLGVDADDVAVGADQRSARVA